MATLLPWLWALTLLVAGRLGSSHGRMRWCWRFLVVFFLAMECVATWALVKTYSRGALVGAVAALALAAGLSLWMLWRQRSRARPPGQARRQSDSDGPAVRPYLPEEIADESVDHFGPFLGGLPVRSFLWKPLVVCLGPWLTRGLLLVVLLGLSDFTQRLTPDYASTDRSVTNRVALWKGGLELMAISPLRGWGWGESGASFMHWTQPVGRAEGYKSMVNSYLTVGVEGGLPVLTGVICACLIVLFLGIRDVGRVRPPLRKAAATHVDMLAPQTTTMATDENAGLNRRNPCPSVQSVIKTALPEINTRQPRISWLSLAAVGSWLAWLVCLFFSNLWIMPLLWVVPAVALVVIVWQSILRGSLFAGDDLPLVRMGRYPLAEAGLAIAICVGLWLWGGCLESDETVAITREADGTVTLALRHVVADTTGLIMLPDAQVLGEAYGQELRRWVIASHRLLRLRVVASPSAILPVGMPVVALGEQCSDTRLDGHVTIRLHPLQSPAEKGGVVAGSMLQLAGIDVGGKNAEWEEWADQHGVLVGHSWGLATDVRARWPELILGLWPAASFPNNP